MNRLEKRMVLHRFMCNRFGYPNLREFLCEMNSVENQAEGDRQSLYARYLMEKMPDTAIITRDEMDRYDRNIERISVRLKIGADSERSWKTFQYLALLFTECYLDLLCDKEGLAEQLNRWIRNDPLASDIAEYEIDQLDTLAFQSATGSGKTLLMHAHIHQYLDHLEETGRRHTLDKIILVTPDEGLSRQHLRELRNSRIAARLFSDMRGSSGILSMDEDIVDIIDLHKLSETQGIKRVSLESFGENNLVLVDEGHLGMGGNKWRNHRKQLGQNGFTFEYSATFNQAVAGNAPDIRGMRDEYGKSILFDYSYKYFHEDGYGKNYRISNLKQTDDSEINDRYLLACLLMFYQQCRIHAEKGGQWLDFNLSRPLCVFLGRTVTGGAGNAKQQETRADVIYIVQFISRVLSGMIDDFKAIIEGDSGLMDAKDQDPFANSFEYLKSLRVSCDELYDDLRWTIFRGEGRLRVVHLAGEDEIQLRAGDSTPFGVINVGDASGLYQALFEQSQGGGYSCEKGHFNHPLFDSVDTEGSPVNMVIGARKFIAGWNSWRVSTMGLMHVGTGEGPQIIQMFGRGVRLKGYGLSLKRHTELPDIEVADSKDLALLETLNIFGLKADYMNKFKEYLQQDGLNVERVVLRFPTSPRLRQHHLKQIRKNPTVGEFEFSERRLELPIDDKKNSEPVSLDRYGNLEILQSQETGLGSPTEKNRGILDHTHLRLIDWQRVYHRIIERKHRSKWYNLTIRSETIRRLFEDSDWYQLHIRPEKLEFRSYEQIREWEDIAVDLICLYARRYWIHQRSRWEHDHLEVIELDDGDENMIGSYEVSIDASEDRLIAQIEELIKAIAEHDFPDEFEKRLDLSGNGRISALFPSFHAYIPILYADRDAGEKVKSIPGLLNDGEARLVGYLRTLLESERIADRKFLSDKKIYLMRNQTRGRGISFFDDYAFYPDFILWMITDNRQDILFIDPKGMVFYNEKTHSKVELHRNIKETETRIRKTHPDVFLHSYIWSVSDHRSIGTFGQPLTRQGWEDKGVYFASEKDKGLFRLLQHAMKNPSS